MAFLVGRRTAAAFVAAAVVGVLMPMTVAHAGDGVGDVPSVAVQPADPAKDDPNGGQWFLLTLAPGQSGTVRAKVSNPARVVQTVTFALRDLTFADDGTPSISSGGTQQDVGSWGGPGQKSFELAPLHSVVVPFSVKVPSDAEPGDHVGAVVAITANTQGKFRVVRQVATRFYVTVPGEAVRAYSILSVTPHKNSGFWPSSVNTEVVLRNDGRTRIRPRVTIGGKKADGSRLLLSRSVEKYTATTKTPWYGGPVNLSVRAVTDDGTVRTSDKSIFVIPWGLIVTVIVGSLVVYGLFRLIRGRVRRVSNLRSDVERLERLVARQAPAPAKTAASMEEEDDDDENAVAVLLVAIKRAQRSGSPSSVARLALALHESGGPAVPWLVGVLGKVEGRQREDVVAALRTSDPAAVATEIRRADLSATDRDAVLSEDAPEPAAAKKAPTQRTSTPRSPAKSGAKTPAKVTAKVSAKAPASRRTGSKGGETTSRKAPAPRRAPDDDRG